MFRGNHDLCVYCVGIACIFVAGVRKPYCAPMKTMTSREHKQKKIIMVIISSRGMGNRAFNSGGINGR